MKTKNVWYAFLSRFFILFNLTKPYERPSKRETKKKGILTNEMADVVIKGEILPQKQTIMLDEVCGYTKTKVKIMKVYAGDHHEDEIIEIYEPYYEGYYRGEKCLMVHEDYEPLHIGSVYTLLLTHEQTMMIIQKESKCPEAVHEMQDEQLFYQVS